MYFEHLEDQLRKEAATKVPLRTITSAILEAEQTYEAFLSLGDREERLSFVREGIEEICVRHANNDGIEVKKIIKPVLKHLSADKSSTIYEGLQGTDVSSPKKEDPTKPIGGGESDQPGDPAQQEKQKEKYKNRDVEEKQKEWHGRDGSSEHQDFNYGGRIPIDNAFRAPSLTGEQTGPEYNPNKQQRNGQGIAEYLVGGEEGGDTNPASHKNIDKSHSNAKEIGIGRGEEEPSYSSAENDWHKAPKRVDENPQFHDINKKSNKKFTCAGCGKTSKKCSCLPDDPKCNCTSKMSSIKESKDYPWDKCIQDQLDAGHDMESAKKICGSIKAKNASLKEANDQILQEGMMKVIDPLYENEENLTFKDLENARRALYVMSQRDPQIYGYFLSKLDDVAKTMMSYPRAHAQETQDLMAFREEVEGQIRMIGEGDVPFPRGDESQEFLPGQESPMDQPEMGQHQMFSSLKQAGYSDEEAKEIIKIADTFEIKES